MAPSAITEAIECPPTKAVGENPQFPKPLISSGSLDEYEQFQVTPIIGQELPLLQLTDILNDDVKLRDLAILVSQRGVVFFRSQNLNLQEQKVLGQKLSELTTLGGATGLYPSIVTGAEAGKVDENGNVQDEDVTVLTPEAFRAMAKDKVGMHRIASHGWHADTTFDAIPASYSILKVTETPLPSGGDTLWASAYEAYDRLSPSLQKFAETLTATHHQPNFSELVSRLGKESFTSPRGSPLNTGYDFKASHPVICTNSVSGWKALLGAAHQVERGWIDDVSERESEILKSYFLQIIAENHDLQCRFRWNPNDVAIWDNRAVFHTATPDFLGNRRGERILSLGEKPYLDPSSLSRRQALGLL